MSEHPASCSDAATNQSNSYERLREVIPQIELPGAYSAKATLKLADSDLRVLVSHRDYQMRANRVSLAHFHSRPEQGTADLLVIRLQISHDFGFVIPLSFEDDSDNQAPAPGITERFECWLEDTQLETLETAWH